MSFRVITTAAGIQMLLVCEGHLDAEAIAAIERALATAAAAGQQAVLRICRGATADRAVVARLAGYPVERLDVESPFLRAWLEDLRADRARTVAAARSQESGVSSPGSGAGNEGSEGR